MATQGGSEPHENKSVESGQESEPGTERVEIDTSAPFESVKEAANLFGGRGFWKPISYKPSGNAFEHDEELVNIVKAEEQAAQLERDLIAKERETFDVLKELETTKNIVEGLKLKLQKEASEINMALDANLSNTNANVVAELPEDGNHEDNVSAHQNAANGLDQCPSSAPGFILLELKQAKLNLTRTTNDLADIRSTVDLYNKKIEKERLSLEKTRQRLSSNASKISVLEQELNQTKHKAEFVKSNAVESSSPHDPLYFTRELQKLSSETEQFKKVGEAAKSEVLRAMSEIEETKTKIRTAEIRLVAAKKMKEAARASEALALAEIKVLSKCEKSDDVILTFEEYSSLVSKARETDQTCNGRVEDATLEIDEANVSKTEILKKVEEATEEVKITKKSLEEALSRVEAANKGKLAVEEAMRKWRSEHGQKRRSVHNSTNFKNSHPSVHRKEPRLIEANGMNSDELKPVLKPTLSIGQILSRKLLLTEDFKNGVQVDKSMCRHNVSLAQMLGKPKTDDPHSVKISGKENSEPSSAKRKKFGFARISRLVTKQSKKKKKLSASSMRQSI